MPYRSLAQMRKMHALLAEGKISKKTVDEYDDASRGMSLPERVKKKKTDSPFGDKVFTKRLKGK